MSMSLARLCKGICAGALAVMLAGCGRYEQPSDQPITRSTTTPSATEVMRCSDVPPVPGDQEVDLSWPPEERVARTVTLLWTDYRTSKPRHVQYTVHADDPTCARRPDIQVWIHDAQGSPVTLQDPGLANVDEAVVGEATNQLQRYLRDWRDKGAAAAAHKYLTREYQLGSNSEATRLTEGTIKRVEVTSWASPNHFILDVDLDLRFDGDAGAQQSGVNERFVTALRKSSRDPFRFAIATSP